VTPAPVTVPDPEVWARSWLPANDDPVRPLMTLATVDPEGAPAARTVLLSEVSPNGYVFHTDARSAKVAHLGREPRVSLVLGFPDRFQQLVVQGVSRALSAAECAAAYGRRSAYLKHLAWLNDSSFAALSLDERRQRWDEAVAAQPEGPVEPPETWVGFEVTPTRLVFWEGGTELASRRTEFRRSGDGWDVAYLAG